MMGGSTLATNGSALTVQVSINENTNAATLAVYRGPTEGGRLH